MALLSNCNVTAAVLTLGLAVPASLVQAADWQDVSGVAAQVDRLIDAELNRAGVTAAPRTNDEDFLRRVTFDLAGATPSPGEVTLFGLDPNPAKRQELIDRLLASDEFAQNWARYWRDVIFSRATNMRAFFARSAFDEWMTGQLKQNTGWDKVATELMTATGDVREDGRTALVWAHMGEGPEIAAEASRIFLGIQIQCANCHDHPTDRWTREDFHTLAAFFPRVAVRPVRDGQRLVTYRVISFTPQGRGRRGALFENPAPVFRRFDRNRDGKLTKGEINGTPLARFFDRLLERGDENKDGGLTAKELKAARPPQNRPGRGADEHYMPDLNDPASRGRKVDPVFFVSNEPVPAGLSDVDRRKTLAREMTAPDNPWFSKAFVNRIWAEMLGQGFYSPVDDIGPERTALFPQVLDYLAEGFVTTGYDVRWLFRTIANTAAYQRQIRSRESGQPTLPFAAATPTRLRSDQLFNAVTKVFGIEDQVDQASGRAMAAGPYARRRSPREGFNRLFGFDPSTPQDDLIGNVPQALFMMNSPVVNNLIQASGGTRLSQILTKFPDDRDAVNELYLLVLAREPSRKELEICLKYRDEVGNRREAYEDLMWSLLNSSEFLSKR